MVDGVGSATTGSLRDFDLYNQYYSEYLAYNQNTGGTLSFEAYLRLKGRIGYFNEQLENFLETGNANHGDGVKGNTISDNRHVANGNKAIYQSQDEDTYYEFDFESGTYSIIQGSDEAAVALGFGSNTVDTLDMGYKSATATDYTFGNLDDGQDSTTSYLVSGYGNVAYVQQEFDIHYILNALLMNPDDPQYQIAAGIFNDLLEHLTQWCSQADIDALDQVAAQYGTNSAEYKNKLQEVMLANLDQANEWVEEHAHVKYTQESAFTQPTDSTQGTDGTNGAGESSENQVPEYSKTDVLEAAGLLSDYNANNNWCGNWYEEGGKSNKDKNIQSAKAETYNQIQVYVDGLINALKATIGDAWTEEMEAAAKKAKDALINTDIYSGGDEDICDNGVVKDSRVAACDLKARKGQDARGVINIKNLADTFLNKFNEICQNGGKTAEEVQAEQQAAAQAAEQKKSAYKALYDFDIDSAADDAGVPDTVTVVPTGTYQFNEIKAKAEQDILEPLKAKIKSQFAGSNIPEDELEEFLDNAATDALRYPDEWATKTSDYTYIINSNKLIDFFKDAVKTGIKAKGYEF